LQAVPEELRTPGLPVLARSKITLLNLALVRKAALPFQEELYALTPAEPANRFTISCQTILLFEKRNSKIEIRKSELETRN
jgi:hypothetical protein